VFAAGRWRFVPGTGNNVIATTDDLGRFRFLNLAPGDHYIEVVGAPFGPRNQDIPGSLPVAVTRSGGFAPTFFPGTEHISAARPVRVREGEQVENVRIAAQPSAIGQLVGRVVDERLQPLGQTRVVIIRREGDDIDVLATLPHLTTAADGSFVVDGLPYGNYVIQAFGVELGRFGAIAAPVETNAAAVSLVAHPTRTARGRIVIEGDDAPDRSKVTLRLWPTDFISGPAGASQNPPRVDEAWQFEISKLASRGVIRMMPLRGWALKSVIRSGVETLNRPTDFQSEDVTGLEVTLTNRVGSVTGLVTEDGRPARSVGVILFPEDSRLWTLPGGPVQIGRTDSDGGFTMTDLLPGSYLIIAAPPFGFRVPPEPDPEWLAAHRGLATPVVITERQNTSVGLILRR
jgi:hypothetical protein